MSTSISISRVLVRLLAFVASGLLVPSSTPAQSLPRPSAADPLNVQAVVPAARHHSAIASFRGLAEQPVGAWRDANRTVNRIGGWRTYARERDEGDSPQAPATHEGHAGHETKKPRGGRP
ncbi:hypothetical protein [Pseudorhodoferax sp.]|uniref:hypothetical protein n=1 Tax=Pseudorhodoferax sp. TaxID=1993553 RepID=UPI002DD643E1|nr:hypothetical protein [Pseudorhodoferax sp.]